MDGIGDGALGIGDHRPADVRGNRFDLGAKAIRKRMIKETIPEEINAQALKSREGFAPPGSLNAAGSPLGVAGAPFSSGKSRSCR
jgi:hypothetical protein